MRNSKHLILFTVKKILWLVLLLHLTELRAQSYYGSGTYWGTSFVLDRAQGQFSSLGYNDSWGMSTEFYFRYIHDKPEKKFGARIGISYLYAAHGHSTSDVLLHDPYKAPATEKLSNKRSELDVHLMLMREKGKIRPFIDGFVGYTLFSSAEDLILKKKVQGYQDETRTANRTYTPDIGIAAGCLVQLSPHIFVQFKASLVRFANEVPFTNFSNVSNDGFTNTPHFVSTKAEMYMIQTGIIFKLQRQPHPAYNHSGGGHHSGGYHGGHFYGGGGGGGIPLH